MDSGAVPDDGAVLDAAAAGANAPGAPASAPAADVEELTRAEALAKIVARLRQKSDFPTVTDTIRAINRTASSELAPASALCEVILDDVALTGKLLRVVNAACYGQFRGTIGTVSKAVIIVGFDAVRNIATSLLLFDHLQNKDHARQLRHAMAGAYFSALLGDELLRRSGLHGREEIFISTLFHRLGQLLVSAHMHEEHAEIEKRRKSADLTDEEAARAVLGVGYEELGIAIGKLWNFPDPIIASMRALDCSTVTHEQFGREPTRVIAEFAHAVSDLMRPGRENRAADIDALVRQCAKALAIEPDELGLSVNAAAQAFARDAHLMDLVGEKKAVQDAVHRWNHPDLPEGGAEHGAADAGAARAGHGHGEDSPQTAEDHPDSHQTDRHRRHVLLSGLAEIREQNEHFQHGKRRDLMDRILETIYHGVELQRVLLFVRDPQARCLVARSGCGAGAKALIGENLTIPLDKAKSVFFAALDSGADLAVEDIEAEKVRPYIPDWYRHRLSAGGLLLLPVRIGQRPQALIYGDTKPGRPLLLKGDRLDLVKALRDQAVLAIARRQGRPPDLHVKGA